MKKLLKYVNIIDTDLVNQSLEAPLFHLYNKPLLVQHLISLIYPKGRRQGCEGWPLVVVIVIML